MSAIEVKTLAQFKKHVLESDVPVVVYFHAPW
jgi:thioredoxin-like negative regulator of GroEL